MPICFSPLADWIQVEFQWLRFQTGFDWYGTEMLQIQYSVDGVNWVNVGEPFNRLSGDGSIYWTNEKMKVPQLAGNAFAYLGFVFTPGRYTSEAFMDNLIVKEGYYIEENAQIENLTIQKNQIYYIKSPAVYRVTGSLTNIGGSSNLIVEDGAQLVISSNGIPATVQKQILNCYYFDNGGWNLIASPIITETPATNIENMLHYEYDLYYFDQSASDGKEWRNFRSTNGSEGFEIEPKGYLYANDSDITLGFVGTVKSSTSTSVDLVYDDGQGLAGWNLVGNPFTCNATVDMPYYVLNANGDALEPRPANGVIAPCQGIFVQATAAGQSVTFTPSPDAAVTSSGINIAMSPNAIGIMDKVKQPDNLREGSIVPIMPNHNLAEHQDADFSQIISLVAGWNWWVPIVQITVAQLSTAISDYLVQIMSKDGDITLDGETELVPGQMYRLQTNDDVNNVRVTGVSTMASIIISTGTNWLGYIGTAKPVGEVFNEGFGPAEGDKIISQDGGFAIFNGTAWQGTLETLRPGRGYVYYSNADVPKTLLIGE